MKNLRTRSEGGASTPRSRTPGASQPTRGELAGVVALALTLRAVWALAVPVVPVSDGLAYDRLARNLAAGLGYGFDPGHPSAFWPVGTSALYAALYAVFGTGHGSVVVLNLVTGTAVVALTTVLACGWFGPRIGLLCGALLACWPGQVEFTTVLASELPFTLLYLAALLAATRSGLNPAARVALSGACLAGACYVRPTAMLLPLVFAWTRLVGPGGPRSWDRRRAGGIAAEACGTAAVMALLILPWGVRNARVFGTFVPISTNAGVNLWMGNNPDSSGFYTEIPARLRGMNEAQVDAVLHREATRYIRRDPVGFVARTLRRLVGTHDRESIGVVWNEPGLRRSVSGRVIAPLKALNAAYWAGALLLAVFGAVALLRRRGLLAWSGHPAVVLWAYFAAVHAVIVGGDRYHYPSVPLIAALAGLGLAVLIDAARGPRAVPPSPHGLRSAAPAAGRVRPPTGTPGAGVTG